MKILGCFCEFLAHERLKPTIDKEESEALFGEIGGDFFFFCVCGREGEIKKKESMNKKWNQESVKKVRESLSDMCIKFPKLMDLF